MLHVCAVRVAAMHSTMRQVHALLQDTLPLACACCTTSTVLLLALRQTAGAAEGRSISMVKLISHQ